MSAGILQSGFRPPIVGQGVAFAGQPTLATTASYGVPVPGLSTRGILPGQVGGFSSFIGGNAFGDVDPISPGVQNQPGTLTVTGPSTVVAGGSGISAFGSGAVSVNAFNRAPGFDADPFTPGIQSQPGTVTATGPSRIVGGPNFAGGVARTSFGGIQTNTVGFTQGAVGFGVGGVRTSALGGFNRGAVGFGGVVDADPFTPGIQAQPGVITATGPSTVVSGGNAITGTLGAIGGAISGAVGAIGGALGLTSSGRNQVAVVDADPFTPGIQSQPGVVTAVGPSRIVGQTGVNSSGVFGGVVDADPFTPGIQAQPGILTTTATGGMLTSGVAGGYGQIVDADPFTPGIQAQPGVITATGPSTISNINQGVITSGAYGQTIQTNTYQQQAMLGTIANTALLTSGNFQNRAVGGVDLDPFTPGFQSTPGIVTQSGPSRVIGRVGFFDTCPWWLWPLLALLLLAGLIGGLYAYFRPRSSTVQTEDEDTTITTRTARGGEDDEKKVECKNGHINSEGKCVECPEGSTWNGKTCSYSTTKSTVNISKVTVGAIDGETPEGEELDTSVKVTKTKTRRASKGRTIPVFSKVGDEQEINGAIKNNKQDEGVKPEVVTSKPITMTPSVAVDAPTEAKGSDVVSNNIVSVPATVTKKSTPPTYTTSSIECKFSGAGCLGSRPYLGYGNTGSYSIGSKSVSGSTSSGSTTTTTTTSTNEGASGSASGSTGSEASTGSTSTESTSTGSGDAAATTAADANTGSESASSSSSSSSSESASTSASTEAAAETAKTSGTRTVTRTTTREQVVDPIVSEPTLKHMRRF